MILLALRRLLYAASLAVGASAILFFILESGALGDPIAAQAGKHADIYQIGLVKERMGHFRQWNPKAIRITSQSKSLWLHEIIPSNSTLTLGDWLTSNASATGDLFSLGEISNPKLSVQGLKDFLLDTPVSIQPGESMWLTWVKPRSSWARFWTQSAKLFQFDFGENRQGRAIGADLQSRGLRSLALTLPAFVLATLTALALALGCATWSRSKNRWLLVMSSLAMAVSSLAWILFFRQWLAVDLDWFPIAGWEPPHIAYLALPVLIWAFLAMWPDFRLYRTLVLTKAEEGFLQTAQAKGVSGKNILWKHLLPNVLVPILTHAVLALPFLFLGSLLLEQIFQIPGLGSYTVDAVIAADGAVLRATTFLFVIAFLVGQWLSDLACAWIDPRLRGQA